MTSTAENKWNRRDKKRHRRRNGQRQSGKSVFTIQRVQITRAEKLRQERLGNDSPD
jgi:hypothetical protein